MQTIKVTATANPNGVAYEVKDGNFLAAVEMDSYNPGKWAASFQPYGNCNNTTFEGACKFLEGVIAEHFGHFGIETKIITQ